MPESVIKVENLGKKYIIGHQKQEKYTALRDVISNTIKSILTPSNSNRDHQEDFWALKDLNFEIKQGDRVGIIGRNGAGKSTLLKVLSRITEPTTGSIKIKGRVASLLEVGTGFHPELTGRENIFLNGAILGMSRQEIKKKFDEIVAFAEVEKFLDTPVKRYSSGMYVRLAFAVAAHLEPEILVVDEVLAVGDAQFQKKCLGKMEDIGREGRTVLFVSHNMAAIRSLCTKGILLERGILKTSGDVSHVLDIYQAKDLFVLDNKKQLEMKYFEPKNIKIYSPNSLTIKPFAPVKLEISFLGKEKVIIPDVYVVISSHDGQKLIGLQLKDLELERPNFDKNEIQVVFNIASLPLMPGQYNFEIELKDLGRDRWEFIPRIFTFEVAEIPIYGSCKTQWWHGKIALQVNASATTCA